MLQLACMHCAVYKDQLDFRNIAGGCRPWWKPCVWSAAPVGDVEVTEAVPGRISPVRHSQAYLGHVFQSASSIIWQPAHGKCLLPN